jgi:hypothetical protein
MKLALSTEIFIFQSLAITDDMVIMRNSEMRAIQLLSMHVSQMFIDLCGA